MEKTFQQIIENNPNIFGLIGSEYIVRVIQKTQNGIECYIRPSDRDGETINFIIKGNKINSVNKNELIKEKLDTLLEKTYTLEEVKQLLYRQRELCANNAEVKQEQEYIDCTIGYADVTRIDTDSILSSPSPL